MKRGMLFTILIFTASQIAMAQKSFTGIVKYKMTVEGDNRTDSMKVVFGNNKIKTVFFLPSSKADKKIITKSYIDNFADNTTTDIDDEASNYTVSALNRDTRYRFINSNKFDAVQNKLCFRFEADKADVDNNKYNKIVCLASIDYLYRGVLNYSFYGIQPIVIDNRIVFDFSTFEKDGKISRIVLYELTESADVENEFSLKGFQHK